MPDSEIEPLYAAHQGALVRYALGILGDSARAEDVVQEAYIRFWNAARDRLVEEPVAYLYRIVRNLALDTYRQGQRERTAMTKTDQLAGLDPTADTSPTPEHAIQYRDDLDRVTTALAELPERTRIALEMHRLGGCKLREIAAALGISTSLAHKLVADGVEHCKRRLGKL